MAYAINYEIAKEADKMNRTKVFGLLLLVAVIFVTGTTLLMDKTASHTPGLNGTVTPTVTYSTNNVLVNKAEEGTSKEPKFEAVFAVAGLLAVAYLVLRQRK